MTDKGPQDPESVPSVLELNHVFEALGHPRRRYLLYTLLAETELSLWELASKIAAWEHDLPVESLSEEKVEYVYISLYHSHLPKLVDDNIVEFSEAGETIKPASNAEQVLDVLQNAGGSTDSGQETHARSDHDEGRS